MSDEIATRPLFGVDREIKHLIDKAPSIFFNSAFVGIIRILTWIIGIIALLCGIGMIIDSQFRAKYFDDWIHQLFDFSIYQNEVMPDFILFVGVFGVVLGILFIGISQLTRMILKRNKHNMRLTARMEELKVLRENEEILLKEKRAAKKEKNIATEKENALEKGIGIISAEI